jgi:hypothetical protein
MSFPSSVSFSIGTSSHQLNCTGPSGSATKTTTQPAIPLNTIQSSSLAPNPISDLCRAFERHTVNTPCTGILVSSPDVDSKYRLRTCATALQQNGESFSLKTLLSDPSKRLDRKQRYGLALAIASSQMQLHSSSWIGHKWRSDDIHFCAFNGVPQVSRPYIRRSCTISPSPTTSTHQDDTFTSLGILLLELCFGRPLTQSPCWEECQRPDRSSDLQHELLVAYVWATHGDYGVEGEAGREWASAILWLLAQRTKTPSATWRDDLHQKVIAPIEQEHRWLTAGRAEISPSRRALKRQHS